MDKKESDFLAKLLATFKLEADEHVKTLSDCLIALEGNLTDEERTELVETIFRESHSLKGAARSVSFNSIQDICQAMENVLSLWKKKEITPSRELFDTLYAVIDFISKLLLSTSQSLSSEQSIIHQELTQKLAAFLQPNQPVEKKVAQAEVKVEAKEVAKSTPSTENVQKEVAVEVIEQPALAQTSTREKTVRISVQKLDKLFQEVEEMLVVKMTARQQVSELKRLQSDLRLWEKEWNRLLADVKNTEFDQNIRAIFDWQQRFLKSSKEGLNRLTKITTQDYRFVGGMVDTLLEDTKKVLMQPFSTLFDILPRMVRDISHSLGKETHIVFVGSEIEVDRRILEEMKDPLIHLIRNAIDHGIETPEERLKKGKTPNGTITITASQSSGSKAEVIISDDGNGIDLAKVKKSAVAHGQTPRAIDKMSEGEILMLIFHSGISTSTEVTDLSGRGLGMSIVSEKVDKLGGSISVESTLGQGTTFRIFLPLTLATFRGIHLTVTGQDFIMPTHNVMMVLRVPLSEIKLIENRMTINVNGKFYSFAYLGSVLGLADRLPAEENSLCAVIIRAAGKHVAIGVDHILNEQEVLVKGLGKQLPHVRNILAATIMEWGKVIPILNPTDLVKGVIKNSL